MSKENTNIYRTQRIEVRVTPAQKQSIIEESKEQKISVSSLLLQPFSK
jgi:hypothetical protein